MTFELSGKDYVRFSFKHLDDRTPTFMPTPVKYVGSKIVELPGLDPRKAAFYNAGWGLDSTLTSSNGRATSNIRDGLSAKSDALGAEVDLDLGSGLGYDVGFLRYQYPGLAAANTNEIYGALTYGPVTAKYSHTVTDEYFGFAETKGTGYLDVTANIELSKGLVGNAHVGFTRFPGAGKAASGVVNYVDWKLGATMEVDKGWRE